MSTSAISEYVVTEDTERLDQIARTLYGDEGNGAVELLLQANPGLVKHSVDHAGVLPFGTRLAVPARPQPKSADPVRPWE